jgi:DNA-binding transcriptional MerR regulator
MFMRTDHLMAQAVADRVGATKRQIQMWTDAGVLLCLPETDRKGRGRQRLYKRSELPYAAVIAELAKMKLPIGTLQVFSELIRDTLQEAKGERKKFCQAALNGNVESYLILDNREGDYSTYSWADTESTIEILREYTGSVIVNFQRVIQSAGISEESTA